MDKVISWFVRNVTLLLRVGLTNLKISLLALPIYLITQVLVYLYFRESFAQNGFWVIMTPMIVTLAALIPYSYKKRNNPNHLPYYLYHLSSASRSVLLLAVIFSIWLYLYAQCREYNVPLGSRCFKTIVSLGR